MQIRRYGVLFLAVFAAACLLFGCSSGSSDKEQAGKPTPEQMKRCLEEGKDCPVQSDANKPMCTIAPGSSRTLTLTAMLPFIHSTDSASSLNVEYGLAQNDWEGGGVEARLIGSSISQETGNVWTQRIEGTDVRRLLTPEGYPANTIGFKDRLLETGEPQKYMEQGKMSWEEVSKAWKIEARREKISEADKKKGWKIDESGFETRPYAFYLATITFTVSVPGEDKLEALSKNSRFDTTSLIFWPKRAVFDDGSKTNDLAPKEKSHSVPVSLRVSRKQGGGYNGVTVGIIRTGAELTRDLTCE
ncbi:MAG TPA: hypothetical protein PLR60_11140 [Syntrophorhabdaceae bacterium]|nr:hypothetical protein [Syntrophorhabdaceae bacterium]